MSNPAINPQIQSIARDMTTLRHEFHQNPQIGFEEVFAHSRISALLGEWGLNYETIAGTGLVVTIDGKKDTSGKTIALRADMDGLTLTEKSDVPWASKNEGKMHACGHDGHMATLLTALAYLKDNNDFDGTVKILFQPAEEGRGGAKKVIKAGFVENHRVDAMYAFHNWPYLPIGTAAIHTGPVMASNINYKIILHGKGGHGAMPEKANNSLIVASTVLLPKLLKLKDSFAQTHPDDRFVLTPTAFESGSFEALNVISDDAMIGGTIRTHSHEIVKAIPSLITGIAEEVAHQHDMSVKVIRPNTCAMTVNDINKAMLSHKAIAKVISNKNIQFNPAPAMTAEDFGEFSNLLPISYIWIGNAVPADPDSPHSQSLHNPGYDFNDDVIPIGAQYFVNIIKEELPLKKEDLTIEKRLGID